MKFPLIIFILIAALGLTAPAQKAPAKPSPFKLKKQIFVDDIESQLSSIPYAAVRVNIRYRLAAWLWKTGKDDTNRAEALAVKAVDELYEKADEIENSEWLRSDLFTLLEQNAKETAARLKTKYGFTAREDLSSAYQDLDKKGGDKAAADKIIKLLSGTGEFDNTIPFILTELREMKSPQFLLVLSAILDTGESGRIEINSTVLLFISDDFRDPIVPVPLQRRYFSLLINMARAATQTPGPAGETYIGLLGAAIEHLGERLPDLVGEAEGLKAALIAQSSPYQRQRREIEERIESSADKLSATIEEAEKAESKDYKTELYNDALLLAISTDRFPVAIKVIEILRDLNKGTDFYRGYTDQELAEIGKKALPKDDVDSAVKSIGMIRDEIRQADAWKTAALYYKEKKNTIDAEDALSKAIKLLADADKNDPQRTYALIRLIPGVQKVNKVRISEVIVLAARAIGDLPPLGVDDKPGTDGFRQNIVSLMAVNFNINSTMNTMLKENRPEAVDFAGRIQKREVRILADLLVGIDDIERAQKVAAAKKAGPK
jgi:hypothetical protein